MSKKFLKMLTFYEFYSLTEQKQLRQGLDIGVKNCPSVNGIPSYSHPPDVTQREQHSLTGVVCCSHVNVGHAVSAQSTLPLVQVHVVQRSCWKDPPLRIRRPSNSQPKG